MEDDDLTPEEMEELAEIMPNYGSGFPTPSDKPGLFSFFKKILRTDDTTKVANVDEFELNGVRNFKEGSRIAELNGFETFKSYFNIKAENILATSDSKDGFLIKAAITSKKEVDTKLKTQRRNKGWFKKKEQEM